MKLNNSILVAAALLLSGGLAFVTYNHFAKSGPAGIEISSGSALLYYNTPAAVRVGTSIFVGHIDMAGRVKVVEFDTNARKIEAEYLIHDYGAPDDHAAPALWPTDKGLLIATAFHSTDLFLYRLDEGTVRRVCHLSGKFTYPRFAKVDGDDRLYLRDSRNGAGNLSVTANPEACANPEIAFPAEEKTWLYASVSDDGRAGWSVWDGTRHSGAFLDGRAYDLAPSTMEETLVWSLSGPYFAVTRFEKAFKCCGTGTMIAELYSDETLLYRGRALAAPYYPTGITISRDQSEALFPEPDGRFSRKQLPSLDPLETCRFERPFNSRAQYVLNGGGAYIWQAFDAIEERDYAGATIMLCD